MSVARDAHRTLNRATPDPHVLEDVAVEMEEAPSFNDVAAQQVDALLQCLTPLERQVMEMRAAAGMRHKDIGDILWPHLPNDRLPGNGSARRARRSAKTYRRAMRKVRSALASSHPET